MTSTIALALLLFLIGTGAGMDGVKTVAAPDCGGRAEYVSNATEFDIGGFGSGFDSFVLAVNETRVSDSGIRVRIENDSVTFLTNCQDCESDKKWEVVHKEKFNGSIVLPFIIYNEVGEGEKIHVSGDFKSAKGKTVGLWYQTTDFVIDTTGDEVRVSYDSVDPC